MINILVIILTLVTCDINAFLQPLPRIIRPNRLYSTADVESEIKSMRAGAIKQELESYGISTKSFLEKDELVDALLQARKEGKTPIATSSSTASRATETSSSPTETSYVNTSSTSLSPEERQAKLNQELEVCKSMKVSDLREELESYGMSTASFFEKTEFVRAVAEARVDGVPKQSKKKKRRTIVDDDDEEEVVSAKVEVITNDSEGPKTKKSREASASSANPFSGGGTSGSDFGPMGGMGGIADMLKNMGGMPGGMGGSPFGGGAGGNPFGGAGMEDTMKKAQEAMKNPKVMEVIGKAQKNPKVMAAVQECMGNPMAMAKYLNDPEVGPIIKELQSLMM
eukprot:scaffold12387_cov63-Cyclotella_meneghiniana.AAC.2